MAKKRDAIFDEAQIGIIKSIVGQAVLNVGTKMRYTETPDLNDPNDIPNYAALLEITGGGLSYLDFSEADLEDDGFGGFKLPYTLPSQQSIIVMRIDFASTSQILFPQYSFEDSAILGFLSDETQSIRVWSTGVNIVPPPTPPAPVFTLQPAESVTVLQGKTLTITATANDTNSYQWFKDGVNIVGANTSALTVTDFNGSKAGTYHVMAIGTGGTTSSNNSIVVNDVGVLVNNFTGTDIVGGTHTGVAITATDGTDILNIAIGTQGRLRSGVTITISGYGSTLLTAQDGVGTNTNMSTTSQAFNSPINSPLSIYSRDESGTCYVVEVPNSELSSGGQDLYITIKRPGQSTSSSPYYGYLSGSTPPSGYTSVLFCSEIAPTFKYGTSGVSVAVSGINITTGGSCATDGQCNI